jgi:hypothetical protein
MRTLALAALLFAGCQSTRPCPTMTLFVTVVLDAPSSAADRLDLDVLVDDVPMKTNALAHNPGETSGTVEVDFPSGYPIGHVVRLDVRASAGGQPLGAGSASTPLGDDCTNLEVDVAAP